MSEQIGPPEPLAAGAFSTWLQAMRTALAGKSAMDVACGDCRGCCTSSYFIKVRPYETAALGRIDAENLRPIPGAGNGNMLMGFDERGHCLMYANGNCSIYQDRPETCRTYDCRVFSAAGMDAGEDKHEINARIARWCFDFPHEQDQREYRAVRAAAAFLRQHPVRFPGGRIPSRPSEIAVLAVKTYQVFLNSPTADSQIYAAIIAASQAFDRKAPTEDTTCTA